MNWTLSAFTDEAGTDCSAQIKAAQRAGLKYLDLRNVDGYNITALPVARALEIKAEVDAAGLKVQMFGSPIGKIDIAEPLESDLERLRHLGELAPVLGCSAVRIFSFYNREERPVEEWRGASLERLTQLRDLAESLGLVLYHENERHIFGDELENVLALAELRSPHFKLIFDFDNFNQGGQDVWRVWLALQDSTDSFHLKDSVKTAEGYAHVPIGEGGGQAKRILAAALERGWSGPLALEPHLSHSGAVAATGPSGLANAAYSGMPLQESFQIAAQVAENLLQELGAPI